MRNSEPLLYTGSDPYRAHPGDAGLDLRSAERVGLAPGERRLVGTGFACVLPAGTVGYITPRSGLAARAGVTVLNAPGTVDSGYRGEVKINLVNLGGELVVIEPGDRIAQLVVHSFIMVDPVEVEALPSGDRGASGHGSSGV